MIEFLKRITFEAAKISENSFEVKTKGGEKEKDKLNLIFKTKNKYSMTKEKDREYNNINITKKDEKQNI